MPRNGGPDSVRADRPVEIDDRWCKGCDICVAFCPKGVIERPEGGKAQVAHPEQCTRCGLCEVMCPDFAIIVRPTLKARDARGEGGEDGDGDASA